MRDNDWLKNRFEYIWANHFADVKRINDMSIAFGKKARTRLGSIKQLQTRNKNNINPSFITITGYFRDEIVPEYVVDLVIAHELCHYAHGFCSPHPQLFKNPHEGKIIDKELYKRGYGEEIKMQKKWLKEEWPKIIRNNYHSSKKVRISKQKSTSIWNLLFGS